MDMNRALFTALGEPTRLQIVEFLKDGPRPVGDIVGRLQLDQPKVSKHLRVLSDAGLVEVRPVAQQRIYSLNPQRFQELDAWLASYRRLWTDRMDRFANVLDDEQQKQKENRDVSKP